MRKGEITKKVLLAAGVGLAVSAVLVAPGFGILINDILKEIRNRENGQFDKRKVTRVLNNLKKRKLVKLETINGEFRATFNEKGQKLIIKYKLKELQIFKPAVWDRKWRIVIFDIPEEKKKARDILRNKLKQLCFFQLQKSVFIYPYECQKEIDLVSEIYGIESYVDFVRAEYVDREEEMKKHFKLV